MKRHVNMNRMVPSFCGARNFYSNREWWTRALLAIEAIASPSDRKFGYGAAMLTVLAQSGAASNEEKTLLDTAWKTTGTQMWDSAISRLLAERGTVSAAGDNSRSERPERIREGSDSLYREVLAARLKVVLEQELDRQTSPLFMNLRICKSKALPKPRAGFRCVRVGASPIYRTSTGQALHEESDDWW